MDRSRNRLGPASDGAWYYPTEEAATKDTDREAGCACGQREKEIRENRLGATFLMEYSFPELPPLLVQVSPGLGKGNCREGPCPS